MVSRYFIQNGFWAVDFVDGQAVLFGNIGNFVVYLL